MFKNIENDSNSEKKISPLVFKVAKSIEYIKTSFLPIVLLVLMSSQIYYLGQNDYIFLLLMTLSMLFIYRTLKKLAVKARKAGILFAKKNSWLYHFLSKETSYILNTFVFFQTFFVVLIFSFSIKHIYLEINYHLFILLPILIWVTHIIFSDKDHDKKGTVDRKLEKNLNEDFYIYGKTVWHIIYASACLAFLLALIFSTYDVIHLPTVTNIDDVFNYSEKEFYPLNEHNYVSRKIINFFILTDNVKIYIINQMVSGFNLLNSILSLYLFFLAGNLAKYLFVSWSLSIIYLSVTNSKEII